MDKLDLFGFRWPRREPSLSVAMMKEEQLKLKRCNSYQYQIKEVRVEIRVDEQVL